jgi:hypothetical protein
MGKIEIVLKGDLKDLESLYDHLAYHTKTITDAKIENEKMTFTVTL